MSEFLTVNDLPYFAYGSNLNDLDWRTWCEAKGLNCGSLTPIAKANGMDYRLVFGKHSTGRKGGVADIRPARGHVVEGVLFELTQAQRKALALKEGAEAKEGRPAHYEPFTLTVQDEAGALITAFSYRVTAERAQSHVTPHKDYVGVIAAGLSSHGLSPLGPWEAAGACGNTPSAVAGIFVYGTLLTGQNRSAVIPSDAVRHPAVASGRIVDTGTYPAFIPGPHGNVRGELIEFADVERVIENLDRIEGYVPHRAPAENLFQRRLITLAGPDGAQVKAWTYIFAGETGGLPVIQSGDWRFHQGQGRAEGESFAESVPPTIGSHQWILTELRRLRRSVTQQQEVFAEVSALTYGDEAFWRGGEVLLIGPEFHDDLRGCRDEVVLTRHAAGFTGLFVMCQAIFDQSARADSWRAVYGRMSRPIRASEGTFAQQAIAALTLAQDFAAELASATLAEGAV